MTEAKSYKDTVNLPKTKFDMRANSVKREPELQKFWADQKIYDRVSQENPGELFILHDGPPYANGQLHIGHALNKILKDIINRYQILQGRKVRYVPGWDCHGLPIELKVLQDMKQADRQKLTPLALRLRAKQFAEQTMAQQRESFKRYGVWGDWDNPYLTLKPEYEAAQIAVFGEMVLKGYIYRGKKPVHWSPSSKTALAEAELEYPEGHTSRSLYVAFQMTKLSDTVKSVLKPFMPHLMPVIWTTTPWTIPANLAIAVNPELKYAVVKTSATTDKFFLVAFDLVEKLSQTFGEELTVVATVTGKDLENCTYKHPLFDRESPVVIGGDYITADSGTGLVHTAPGHGQEDFIVGARYGLPILSPVDEDGNFTAEAGPFAGKNVLGDGNGAVVDALTEAGALIKEEKYAHSYPYDWRTKKPTIFRATEQWFASVEGFRDAALKAIAEVNWIPAQGEKRITAMVSDRSDWCISRQRAWGVPIPVFYDEETNEPLLNAETIAHVQQIIAASGSDAWWELSETELLPESYRNNGHKYRKGTDTMDVWFDSGSSWAAVARQREELRYPVDMYLEGSDQHRGWFQSSLLTSVATTGHAPYKTVLTHGFVLDEQGRKMSKSLGNVVDPAVVIKEYGADVLRLWVSSVDYSSDVPLGQNMLKQLADVYRKIRNTARFLLGNLHDFDPVKDGIPYEKLPELDRYMLHRMTEVFSEVKDAFDKYQFFRFFQMIQNFCVVDLSNFYLDIAKDRLYISAPDSFRRRSCQTVMAIALENLARAIAPVLCHLGEDIWQFIPYPTAYKSVFEAGWVKLEPEWCNPELGKSWESLRQLRGEVNKVLEQARNEKAIGSSLEAKVLVYVSDQERQKLLVSLNPLETISPPSAGQDAIESVVSVSTPPTPPEEGAQRDQGQNTIVRDRLLQTVQLLSDFLPTLGNFYEKYKSVLTGLLIIFGGFLSFKILDALIKTINEIPLFPSILQLIGLAWLGWFVLGNLLYADDREKLSQTLQSWIQEILGRFSDDESKPVAKSQEEDAIEDAIVTIPSPPSPFSILEKTAKIKPESSPVNKSPLVGNGIDELRYLFITSGVELLESPEVVDELPYSFKSDGLAVGVTKADGQKCDRCWNYSTHVGESQEDPLICERCVAALDEVF